MASGSSLLPKMKAGDPSLFKSTLSGVYKLRVIKVVDISKPSQKPIDEIEEPEEESAALENRLSKTNARMIQLDLLDSENTTIRAIETERIDTLSSIKPNNIIEIKGPVDLRCGNILLEKRHVISIETVSRDEISAVQPSVDPKPSEVPVVQVDEDWDEDEENDCIILD